MTMPERQDEGPGRERPERDQDRVLVELQTEKIVKWQQRQQERRGNLLLTLKPKARKQERDIEPDAEIEPGQQIIGPIREWKDREPTGQDQSRERRMLREAPVEIARPDYHLAEIGVDALARLGDDGIERPHRRIDERRGQGDAMATQRIAQRLDETPEHPEQPRVGGVPKHQDVAPDGNANSPLMA